MHTAARGAGLMHLLGLVFPLIFRFFSDVSGCVLKVAVSDLGTSDACTSKLSIELDPPGCLISTGGGRLEGEEIHWFFKGLCVEVGASVFREAAHP